LSTAKSVTSVSYAKFSPFHRLPETPRESDCQLTVRLLRYTTWYHREFFAMLRAALIGFASSGKTTLFQLMTSAHTTGRAAHGKGETAIGISKVPDERLDRLTAMYNPRKRVPATVEFTDLVAP